MRRVTILLLLAAFAPSAAPARADHAERPLAKERITFETTGACLELCPRYVPVLGGPDAACTREPVTVPGSWDDRRVVVPAEIAGRVPAELYAWAFPLLDSDLYLCLIEGAGTPAERWRYVDDGARPGDLDGTAGQGRTESVRAHVEPGQTYVLRLYNVNDVTSVQAELQWLAT